MNNACIFLDRDGVINKNHPNYTFRVEDFRVILGVVDSLRLLKSKGYFLVVVTNQSGIAQGLYSREQMETCHQYFQQESGNLIDHSISHPIIHQFQPLCRVSPARGRDILPARKLGIKTIQIGDEIADNEKADYMVTGLPDAVKIILS